MSLGLSETDAHVYVFLALNGPHKAREIATRMNLYKEQLYRSLRSLQDKDIAKGTVDHPAVFFAIPFEKVLDLLAEIRKEQESVLRKAREELLSTWQSMTSKNATPKS